MSKLKDDRRTRYKKRLSELGLVQVSAWVPQEQRMAVSRVAETARVDVAGLAADYTTALVEKSQRELAESFIESGNAAIVLFHMNSDDTRKTVGVKLLSWRCLPILVSYPLTPDTYSDQVAEVNPTLAKILKLQQCGWETPEYRDLCVELGLDPDYGRPKFLDNYEQLGERLVAWVSDHDGRYDEVWENESGDAGSTAQERRKAAVDVVCDFVDLLRSDGYPTPALIDRVREKLRDLPPGLLPFEDTLRKMASGEELLEHGRRLVLKGKRPAPEYQDGLAASFTTIDFLPSRYGLGYCARLHSSQDGDVDGWSTRDYGDLRGVALDPSPEALASSSWLTIVVRHLKEQGVLFMTREQAQTYLDTEALYWVYGGPGSCGFCRLPKCLTIRQLSWGEKQLWRIRRPLLVVDQELVRREMLHPRPCPKDSNH